jgi:hypothetical protein
MRCEFADHEWAAGRPVLPNKPRPMRRVSAFARGTSQVLRAVEGGAATAALRLKPIGSRSGQLGDRRVDALDRLLAEFLRRRQDA